MEECKIKVINTNDKNEAPQEITLNNFPFTIGRSSSSQLILNHSTISLKHAEISCDANNVVSLKDLESSNGTWKDNKKIGKTFLNNGAIFRIGPYEITFLREVDCQKKSQFPRFKIRPSSKFSKFEKFLEPTIFESYSLKLFSLHFVILTSFSFIFYLNTPKASIYGIFFLPIIAIILLICLFISALPFSLILKIARGRFYFSNMVHILCLCIIPYCILIFAFQYMGLNNSLSHYIALIFSIFSCTIFWYYYTALLVPQIKIRKTLAFMLLLSLAFNGGLFNFTEMVEIPKLLKSYSYSYKELSSKEKQGKLKNEHLPAYPEQKQIHLKNEISAPQ